MKRIVVRTILLLLVSASAVAQLVDAKGGLYSRSAVSIWGSHGELVIPSPDGRKVIAVQAPRSAESDEIHTVAVKANGREYKTRIGAWVNAEAAWSPDSKAFFVTYSDGGNVGTYHVKVVYVTNAGLRVIEPIANGRRLFVPTCFAPERPNVGAIKFVGPDSSRLLIAVQVPPHSICASMGTFRVFEIALPDGKFVSRYGQIEAKKLFGGDMGGELRDADDACIQRPQTCVPPGLNSGKVRAGR